MINYKIINMVSIFTPVSCFAVSSDKTAGYCIGNIIMLMCSILATIYSVSLLVWHLQVSGWKRLETYKSYPTWIFLMLPMYTVITCIRYMFLFNDRAYYLLVLFNSFI